MSDLSVLKIVSLLLGNVAVILLNWKQLQNGWCEDYCLNSVADYLQNLNTLNRKLAEIQLWKSNKKHILMLIGLCIIAIVDEWKTNTTHKRTQWSQSIIDSGQNQLKYTYQLQQGDKTHHTKHTTTHRTVTLMLKHPSLQNKTTDVVIHQHSRKLLKMDILMPETCWVHNKWNKIASDIKLVFHSSIMHVPLTTINM